MVAGDFGGEGEVVFGDHGAWWYVDLSLLLDFVLVLLLLFDLPLLPYELH